MWLTFASGYQLHANALGWWWRALWVLAGVLIGYGMVADSLGRVAFGVGLLAMLIVRCLVSGDVVIPPRDAPEPVEADADYDPLASVRTPYDPPTRVLGPHHDGSEL